MAESITEFYQSRKKIMYTTTVTAEGQVMIPKEILQQLDIQAGSQIDFEIYEGKLVLIPVIENIQAAFGLLKANKSVSLEEMNYAITQRVIEEYDQS